MKAQPQTMLALVFCFLVTACVSGGSKDDTNNSNTTVPDAFSLAEVATQDTNVAVDTWTEAPDLVASQDVSWATPDNTPNNDGGCKVTLRAEARDTAGPCTTCTFGDYITLVGVAENTCDQTITYTSDVGCLVSEFVVLNLFHKSKAEYPISCKQIAMNEVLEPGQELTKTRPAGTLSAGDYKLTVQFEDPARTEAELLFTVE